MKALICARTILILALGLSVSGCAYLAADRDGSFFPSTRDILNAKDKYWIPPTLGVWILMFGSATPYVGPVIFYPTGFAVHYTEAYVVAPVYDIALMPYDLCKRPEYLERCRLREEKSRAEMIVRENLDAALDDGRYLSPSNTVYHRALSGRLANAAHDSLTTGQVDRIMSAIRRDETLLIDMCGVAGQIALGDDGREWFLRKAIELRNGGRGKDADIVAAAICRSRKLSDDQYEMLVAAGFSAVRVDSSKRDRDSYNKRLAEKAAAAEARRKEREEYQARERAMEEKFRREREKEKRRKEEAQKRVEALKPFVEALFSDDVAVFRSALKHVDDDPWLWSMWSDAVKHDPYLRKVRHEYLVVMLEIAEREPSKGKWLKKAILGQKELGEELAIKYYAAAVSARDEETIRILLRNRALPDHILRLAYANPDFAFIRYAAAMSRNFPWPQNSRAKNELAVKGRELFRALKRGDIDKKSLAESLDSLMKEMLPAEMPANWRSCLPQR